MRADKLRVTITIMTKYRERGGKMLLLDLYQNEYLELNKTINTVHLSLERQKFRKSIVCTIRRISRTQRNIAGFNTIGCAYIFLDGNCLQINMVDLPKLTTKKHKELIAYIKSNLDKIWELYNNGVSPNKEELTKLLQDFKFSGVK
jgi:hypothetical protein